MALTITNNVSSLIAQHNVSRTNMSLKQSLERLSSGFKINRGSDGPAALVISEKQRLQIAGLNTAIDNTEKAVSLVQTAEGALSEINSLLTKVRSLAIDSANAGVNDEDSFEANQREIDNALDTINRIAENTQFGTKKLLDGSSGISGTPSDPNAMNFLKATSDTQEGSHVVSVTQAGERAVVTAASSQGSALAQDEVLTINGVNIELFTGMDQGDVETRINEFTALTGVEAQTVGGFTELFSTVFGESGTITAISNQAPAADSSGFSNASVAAAGVDVQIQIDGQNFDGQGNVVTVSSGLAKGLSLSITEDTLDPTTTKTDSATVTINNDALVFQIGANQYQNAEIAIGRAHSESLGIGVSNNDFANLSEINVTNADFAQDAIAIIDAAVDDVTNLRGDLGAFQANTLESTANNLRATLENTVNAESVIRDTDFAEEIANFTKQQVLMQSGTSVLGNANQIPQLVLSLLN